MLPYPARSFEALGPAGERITAFYKTHLDTAYFELALTCGLTLTAQKNPLLTHTEGLGMGIKQALKEGYKKILVFAGGSATNDAGLGALYALGYRFYDPEGNSIRPRGGNLYRIATYESPILPKDIHFAVATDVRNPFTGPEGATYTYAPQKGAKPEDLPLLEAGMVHIEKTFATGPLPSGAGAAGGLAGGFYLFLSATIFSASDLLLRGVKEKVEQADFVVTGEGRIDAQTLHGKLVTRILDMSTEKKFILIAGHITTPIALPQILWQEDLTGNDISTEYAIKNAKQLLRNKAQKLREFLDNKRNTHNINA